MKLNPVVIKDARDRKGKTQQQISEALGMSIATVNSAENGKEIYHSTAVRLCEYLDVELAHAVISREMQEVRDGVA